MIPRKGYLRRKLEATFLRFAAGILMHRNCARSLVVSRPDNNDMWHKAERLESIADRISSGYPNA